MKIKRIGNVILEVKDLDASLKFYHEVLGMPIKNERRNWIDLGQESGGMISLHPASITTSSNASKENGILIGLTVGDLESALDDLKKSNVQVFREIQERHAGKNAVILDPDGYMIALFEPDFSDQKDKQTTGYVGFTPE
tara:strand:+ start:355 stop:771 length:417 start_codon:yes stop_codon:yes gene_type:complete